MDPFCSYMWELPGKIPVGFLDAGKQLIIQCKRLSWHLPPCESAASLIFNHSCSWGYNMERTKVKKALPHSWCISVRRMNVSSFLNLGIFYPTWKCCCFSKTDATALSVSLEREIGLSTVPFLTALGLQPLGSSIKAAVISSNISKYQ